MKPEDCVFVDEMGCCLNMNLEYGRSPCGERVFDENPTSSKVRISTVAALTKNGIEADFSYTGSMTAELFVVYLQTRLLEVLSDGKVLIMDNLRVHHADVVMEFLKRWLEAMAFTVVGDGAYACVALAHACSANRATLVSRLRLDARLFGFPETPPPGKRGRKPKKGTRLPSLKSLLDRPDEPWRETGVTWYGGGRKAVRLLGGVALWHTPGEDPVRLRWVLVVDPTGETRPQAFFATDTGLTPERIVEVFVLRWSVETLFAALKSRGFNLAPTTP